MVKKKEYTLDDTNLPNRQQTANSDCIFVSQAKKDYPPEVTGRRTSPKGI